MIITSNNNLSPLPFYSSLAEQNHRKSYAYNQIYPLYGSTTLLLPFQILRPHSADALASADVYDKEGNHVADLFQQMSMAGLQVVSYASYGVDVVMFPANIMMLTNLEEGMYYLKISDGTNTWYSDIITLINNLSAYLKIEWWDVEDLMSNNAIICYKEQYKNRVYLSTQLGKPDYTFEEEGESRDGYFFAEKQVSSKTYKANFLASEPLIDVMRLIRLADMVNITDRFGNDYVCDTFLMTPTWQTQGDLASVDVEFTTSTVVKKVGWGYVQANNGDFNNDFNNDFLNS